jgi:hypothetical protein
MRLTRIWLLAVGGLTVLLCVTYAVLSVYKAIQYTTTPRQQPTTATPADSGLAYEDITFPSAATIM